MGLVGDATVAPPETRCDGAAAFAQARVNARPAMPATPPPPAAAVTGKAKAKAKATSKPPPSSKPSRTKPAR